MTRPALLTTDFNETILQRELAGIRSGIAAVRRLYPEAGAESIEIAGGLVAFTGVESPLSQSYGIARQASVTAGEIDEITSFYETRGATPRVFVTPFSDPSLGRRLAAAGYAPSEYESLLVSDCFDSYAALDDRISVAANLNAWARASAQAFMDVEMLKPGDDRIAMVLASSDGVSPLEAREGDAIVATAAMDVRDGCAALFAGSTMPAFRNRGWHTTMIRDRIARARAAGARSMHATAKPASISERNFHRCGFITFYTRTLWERSAATVN
ncbi:MAG: hypothetical protein JOZ77_02360 [Candidatus Eremiobacteraeota bacterium]|nr:hypothetical protein [Candidatus Eremiobacteraeota bacterium]